MGAHRERWNEVRVEDSMLPIERVRVLDANDHATAALQGLAQQDPIPVVERRQLVGLARRDDSMRWLAWHAQ